MLIIGSHVGYKKDSGLVGSVKEALSYNANTFMFYTGAPQNTVRSSIDLDNVKEAEVLMKESGIDKNNVKGTFYYKGKERPKYPICLVIEELPFPDCPASSMGL